METSRRLDEGLGSQSGTNGGGAGEAAGGARTGGLWWCMNPYSNLPPLHFFFAVAYITNH